MRAIRTADDLTPEEMVKSINGLVADLHDRHGMDTSEVSDGYHTFGELYEFRMALTNALFKHIYRLTSDSCMWEKFRGVEDKRNPIWKSKLHSDGTMFDGYFITGCYTKPGEQITFHYKLDAWDLFDYAKILDRAPEWDGHTPADVLERIKNL